MKKKVYFSLNFNRKNRAKKDIKFIIFHYTGMQSEIDSIKRLTDSKSKVSCHYLINRKGSVFQLIEDNKVAWHAGKSKWKNFTNLNQNSIGIELVNKGHKNGYQSFSKNQIRSLISLCKKLKKKYNIKKQNFLGHSDIAPQRKIDPGEKFPWKKISKYHLGHWYLKRKVNVPIKNHRQIRNLFFKNLFRIGYRYFKIKEKNTKDKLVIKAFQRRYLPNKISGVLDLETLKISLILADSTKTT